MHRSIDTREITVLSIDRNHTNCHLDSDTRVRKWYESENGISFARNIINSYRYIRWALRNKDVDPEWYKVPIESVFSIKMQSCVPITIYDLDEEDLHEEIDENNPKYDPKYICEIPMFFNVIYHEMIQHYLRGNDVAIEYLKNIQRYVLDTFNLIESLLPKIPSLQLEWDMKHKQNWAVKIVNIPEIIDKAIKLKGKYVN